MCNANESAYATIVSEGRMLNIGLESLSIEYIRLFITSPSTIAFGDTSLRLLLSLKKVLCITESSLLRSLTIDQ